MSIRARRPVATVAMPFALRPGRLACDGGTRPPWIFAHSAQTYARIHIEQANRMTSVNEYAIGASIECGGAFLPL
jgi:hypothetical protein